jgi:hypothetical protein
VDKYKRVDCAYYTRCLDVAAAGNWVQFSCNRCKAYTPDDKPLDLLKLALVILNGDDD